MGTTIRYSVDELRTLFAETERRIAVGAGEHCAHAGVFPFFPSRPAMSHATELDRVWQIIEKVGVCMLTTRFEGGLRARPLEARPDRKSDRLLFVTDVSSAKRDEADRWPEVGLVFLDAADKAYLSITGKAQIVDDPDLRAAAWRKNDVVWWPGGPTRL